VSTGTRLAKRHKRQVSRAKARVKLSEPDLRTPEQIKAAREASRASLQPSNAGGIRKSAPVTGHSKSTGTGSAAKTAV
jgi:hypothetical protein